MKTNLDALFKTDKGQETEGIWLDISTEIGFQVRRFGGANSQKVKAAMAKHYKPFARMVENDTLPEAEQRRIMIKLFVEASMINWKGVEIDGVQVPYSSEAAIKLFEQLPEVFDVIMKYAQDYANFKEDLGNS